MQETVVRITHVIPVRLLFCGRKRLFHSNPTLLQFLRSPIPLLCVLKRGVCAGCFAAIEMSAPICNSFLAWHSRPVASQFGFKHDMLIAIELRISIVDFNECLCPA